MVDLTRRNCWDERVEVFQRSHILVVIGETFVSGHHLAHVVIRVLSLLLHQIDSSIEHLDSLKGLSTNR